MSENEQLQVALRDANLKVRDLIVRMRAACLAEQLGGRGMDWIETVIDEAGLWPRTDGLSPDEIFRFEMDEQRRLREEWEAEKA